MEREASSLVYGEDADLESEFQHLDRADTKEQDGFFTLIWKGEGGRVSLQPFGFFSACER